MWIIFCLDQRVVQMISPIFNLFAIHAIDKKETSISSLKDLSIIPDYYAKKVNTIFKKREQGTLDYDSYEDFCYLFSDKNQNNISFLKTKKLSKTYLNPLHWEYIFDSKKEKKIEAICSVDLNELRNLFLKNNQ